MKLNLPLLIFSTILISTISVAATENTDWIRYHDYRIKLPVPKGWSIQKDLFGVPITVLGPEGKGDRAVLLVQHTGVKDVSFEQEKIKKDSPEYFKNKRAWLKKTDPNQTLTEIPFQTIPYKNGNDGFEIGAKYRLRGHDFEDRTAHVICGNQMYFIKTLSNDRNTTEEKKVLEGLVQNLSCEEVGQNEPAYQPGPLEKAVKSYREQINPTWPSNAQIKGASHKAMAETLEALVQFYKGYEESADPAMFAQNPKSPSRLKFEKLFSVLMGSAYAEGGFNCFFGGWPSHTKPNSNSCDFPWVTNEFYQAAAGQCTDGQMACNPILFGDNLCVDVSTPDLRSHATFRCESDFKATGKTYQQLVDEKTLNDPQFPDMMADTVVMAKGLCNEAEYASNNLELCTILKDKLKIAIFKEPEKDDFKTLEDMKSPTFGNQADKIFEDYAEFEKKCFDENKKFLDKKPGCLEALNDLTDKLDHLEHVVKASHVPPSKPATSTPAAAPPAPPSNAQCAGCGVGAAGAPAASSHPECTVEQEKHKIDDDCSDHSDGNCFSNLLLTIGKALWNTVKGIGDLIGMAAKGWWNGVKTTYYSVKVMGDEIINFFAGTSDSESDLADKAHLASMIKDTFLWQFIQHPGDTIWNLGKAIKAGIESFIANDLMCQKWSGVAHWSDCKQPGTWGCASCNDKMNSVCGIVGYVIGELLPAIITAGGSLGAQATVEGAELGVEIAAGLARAGKAGKLAELEAEVVTKLPKAVKAANELKDAAEVAEEAERVSKLAKSAKLAKLGKAADQVAGNLLNLSKTLSKFKSKVFGELSPSIAGLKKLRNKFFEYKVLSPKAAVKAGKTGTWVTKSKIVQPVYWVGKKTAAGLAVPAKMIYKGVPALAYRKIVRPYIKVLDGTFNISRKVAIDLTGKVPGKVPNLLKLGSYSPLAKHIVQTNSAFHDAATLNVTGLTQKQLEEKARKEGKSELEIRVMLKNAREADEIEADLNQATMSGKHPTQSRFGGDKTNEDEAISRLAVLTGQTEDDIRHRVIARKLIVLRNGGDAYMMPPDIALYAKENNMTIEVAKAELEKEVTIAKNNKIAEPIQKAMDAVIEKGERAETDEEIKALATAWGRPDYEIREANLMTKFNNIQVGDPAVFSESDYVYLASKENPPVTIAEEKAMISVLIEKGKDLKAQRKAERENQNPAPAK